MCFGSSSCSSPLADHASLVSWANYKIDHKRDKVGVFISIVSTKVPFKGTGKEYIGDDIEVGRQSFCLLHF